MNPEPVIGGRVVMRYQLPDGYAHSMTDVIGELIALDPPTVRTAEGEVISVLPARVVALKAIAPRPIRAADIRALEEAAAYAWPGIEQERIEGWLLRAGHGFTSRANSAVPLSGQGFVATTAADTLERIVQWYRERDLTPTLALPDRLVPVPPGWRTFSEILVMAADLSTIVLPEGPSIVPVDPEPSAGWLELFRRHDPRATDLQLVTDVVVAVQHGLLGFASLGDQGRHTLPLAIARGAITTAPNGRRWIGLSGLEVLPEHRRHGLGTLICAELLRWGSSHGATHAYLQVSPDNGSAMAMYRALGFVDHHRYRYTMPPGTNE